MVPNKLEKDFKHKLEQRTIAPTEMAWDRLDAMLSVAENKKQPKKKYWMYMAASFLGFLLIGALLLKMYKTTGETGITPGNEVVNKENPGLRPDNYNATTPTEAIKPDGMVTGPVQNEEVAVQQNVEAVKHKAVQQNTVKGRLSGGNDKAIHQDGAVAQQEVQVTPVQEAENLLAHSTDNTPSKKRSSIKVDAGSLLSSVEGELEDNFRSEMLQKVVKNYNTVKTSVANRNYQ
jgi:hypothetical protein